VRASPAGRSGGPAAAGRVVKRLNGNRHLTLDIPAAAAHARLRLRDAAGTTKVVSRPVQILRS
jgi:hypothetical protein